MGEYLPADTVDRLIEIRRKNGYTQDFVAKNIGMSKSTYSRIESRDIESIGHNTIIKLAKLYDVPADFLLAINDAPDKTYFEIKKLGLSVDAAISLYENKVDPQVINRLLVNERFGRLTRLMSAYFFGILSSSTESENMLKDIKYDLLMDFTGKGKLPNDNDVRELKRSFKASIEKPNQYDLVKMEKDFIAVLNEIKKECKEEMPREEKVLDIDEVKKITLDAADKMSEEGISKEEQLKISIDMVCEIIDSINYFLPRDREKIRNAITMLMQVLKKYGKNVER